MSYSKIAMIIFPAHFKVKLLRVCGERLQKELFIKKQTILFQINKNKPNREFGSTFGINIELQTLL